MANKFVEEFSNKISKILKESSSFTKRSQFIKADSEIRKLRSEYESKIRAQADEDEKKIFNEYTDSLEKLSNTYNLKGSPKDSAPKNVYDSFTGMMVEKGQESEFQKSYDSIKAKDKVYSVGYKATESGPFQAIGVVANSESEALEKFKKHKPNVFKVFGASSNCESLETMKMKGKPIIDEAIEKLTKDEDHKVIERTPNGYELGINEKGKLYIAFPGETYKNPHMYLGEPDVSSIASAKTMLRKYKNIKR